MVLGSLTKKLLFFFVCTYLSGAASLASSYASQLSPTEYKLRVAYLYNFAKFIRWPDTAFKNEFCPVIIGFIGEDSPMQNLQGLSSQKIAGRPIEIRRYKTAKDIQHCHLLYVNYSETRSCMSVVKNLKTKPVVTIGDQKHFADIGGVIQFITIRDRLKFIVNLKALEVSGVKIDSRLLSLAIDVRK